MTVRQLKSILKQSIGDLGIYFSGVLFHYYVKQVEENRKVDDDLFQHMSLMKQQHQIEQKQKAQYLQCLQSGALIDGMFMNIDSGYTDTTTEERLRYEKNVHDKAAHQEIMKRMMVAVNNHASFKVDINVDSEKQYAFVKVLRQIRKHISSKWKPIL